MSTRRDFGDITDNNSPDDVFELLDLLGEGAYGKVYKALHKRTG